MERQNTLNWQVSLSDSSEIVKDIDDIAQAIYLILSTVKGSDPLRPTFGSDVWRYIDRPMNRVNPMLIYEIYDSIERWEKRVTIRRVILKDADVDKKSIELIGVMTGTSQEVDLEIDLWDEGDRTYNVIGFGINSVLGDKFSNVLILI